MFYIFRATNKHKKVVSKQKRQRTCNVTMRRVRETIEIATSVTYFCVCVRVIECVRVHVLVGICGRARVCMHVCVRAALLIEHAKHMNRIIL
jgi:hypothetical protein